MNQAVFLDRDGTLIEEVNYLDNFEKVHIVPGAIEAIKLINKQGMKVILITNQSGVARGYFTEEFVNETNKRIIDQLKEEGAIIDGVYMCPHHPTKGIGKYLLDCNCRKPHPGLLLEASKDYNINLFASYVIGDKLSDCDTGKNIEATSILVKTYYGTNALANDSLEGAYDSSNSEYKLCENILEAVQFILNNERTEER